MITTSGWRFSKTPDGHTLALMQEAPKDYSPAPAAVVA
jgi:hypothetical protein